MTAYQKPFFRPEDFWPGKTPEGPVSAALMSSLREKAAEDAEAKLEAAFGNEYSIVMFWKEKLTEERAEVERLEKALGKIRDYEAPEDDWTEEMGEMQEIARAALEGK